MKKHLSIFYILSLFCIVLLSSYGSTVTAAPQARLEAGDEDEDEADIPFGSGYAFTIERGTLTMLDGVKLAVSYWMPRAKRMGEKFPVFFEMNGYRKDDLCYLSWDYPVGAYFARHGYVVAKVDLRGTGDSTGVLPEAEYSEQELSDSVEIIGQFSRKRWSNGNVGG